VQLNRISFVSLLFAASTAAMPTADLAAQSSFSKGEKPFATISRMLMGARERDSLVQLTRDQVGLDYKFGAVAPGKAFDCSGLVQWVMAKFNFDLPRTSREQAKLGRPIPKDPDQLQVGDLLVFGKGRAVDHIGIYVGDGKYVHAANSRKGVVEANLPTGRSASTWWKGVRRLFDKEPVIPQILGTSVLPGPIST
jgi:cell wall-associated NlpC family hydrolase